MALSVFNVLALTLDRFWAVVYSISYTARVTLKATLIYTVMFIIAFGLSVPIFLEFELVYGQCVPVPSTIRIVEASLWLCFIYILPILGNATMFCWIMRQLHKNGGGSIFDPRNTTQYRYTACTLATVVTHTLVLAPHIVYFMLAITKTVVYKPGSPAQIVVAFCITLISWVTPVVYFVFLQQLRDTMVKLIMGLRRKFRSDSVVTTANEPVW
ncbi:unnamed protein product [Dicrocoelium dendriticum]|nr:unnamed protein product [Dicrocoelium dendriticum]